MKLKKWFGVMLTVLMALCFAVAACAPEGGHGAVCEHPADKLVIHEITDDDDKHEVYCTACETVVRTEAHVYDQTTYTCTACEHVCSHTATSWSCNKLTHAEYCSSCGKVITPVGNHVMEGGECSVCGMTQEEIDLEKDPNASDWSIVGKGKGILSASNWGTSEIPNSLYLIKDVDFEGAEGEEKFDVTGDFYVGDVFKVFNKGSWDTQVNFTGVQGGKTDDSENGFKACVKVGKENDNIEVTVNANMTVTLYTGGAGNHLDIKWNHDIDPKPDVPLDYYLVGSIGGDWNSTLVAERKLSLGDNDIYTVDYTVTSEDFPDPTKWTSDQDIQDLAAHPNCAKLAIVSIEQGADLTGATEEIGIMWVPAGTWTFGIVSGSALYWEQGEEPPTFSSFYLRGSLASTNWETGVALTDLGDGSYAIDVTAEVGNEFKIYDNDTGTWYGWPAVSKTDGSSNYVEEKAQDMGGDANIAFTQAGTFTITYKNGTISVAPKAPAHEHVADTEAGWQHDAVGHWHKCTHEGCTEKVDYATHTYDDDSTTCSVCEYEKPTVDPTDTPDTRAWHLVGKGKGSLKGNNWNAGGTEVAAKFTKDANANVFSLTATLYQGDAFKILGGANWESAQLNYDNVTVGQNLFTRGTGDAEGNLIVTADGEYIIKVFTFIDNTDQVNYIEITKTDTVVTAKPENYSMYIVGTINEDAPNTWEDNFNNDTKLTSDSHGVWTITLEITEQMYVTTWGNGQDGSAYIKVKNDVYGEDYGDNGGNIKLSAGKYIITFTESDGKVTVTPWHEHVADTEAGWQHNADGHWYKCTHEGCDEKVNYATHDFASGTCVCGATEDEEVDDTIIVHYHNTKRNISNPITIYVYYGGGNTQPLGNWPGKSGMVTDEGEGWICATFTVPKGIVGTDLYIIFNDGKSDGANQTGDILITAKEVWVNVNEVAFESKEAALAGEEVEPTKTYTFYFYNAKGWSKIGIHIWGDIGNITGGWNTSFMEKDTELGGNWYKFTYGIYDDTDWTGKKINVIIFNSTSDSNRITVGDSDTDHGTPITIPGTDLYFHGDKNQQWFTSADAALGTASSALVAMLPVCDDRLVA